MPRLFLISHASTHAQQHVRFPADDPLSERGRRELDRVAAPVIDRALTAPEVRTVDTAAALGWSATVEPALRDLVCAKWSGVPMDSIAEVELAAWLTDPVSAPHGGEAIVDLIARVGAWLDTFDESPERIGVVTHPAIIKAAVVHALGAPASAFWRVDVRPLSVTRLNGRGGRWTVRLG
ncbi:MAG TPA: histidine phosphatase family protein [Rhodococcus sp. (in: high G+C Gram-positive bacteria)]|nr:histidine phosphatase family protein [Rhodococcus sp. (in: high G+C Gram-positive bacteria)]